MHTLWDGIRCGYATWYIIWHIYRGRLHHRWTARHDILREELGYGARSAARHSIKSIMWHGLVDVRRVSTRHAIMRILRDERLVVTMGHALRCNIRYPRRWYNRGNRCLGSGMRWNR